MYLELITEYYIFKNIDPLLQGCLSLTKS